MSRRNLLPSGRRSKFEDRIAKELDDAGVKYTYETWQYQYKEALRKNLATCDDCGSKALSRTGWYTPDFFLGNGVIIETKGRFTSADRRKMAAIKRDHPDLDIKLLFMRNNKIHKRSETLYSDWCEANGYDYSIGTFKKEWIQ